MFLFTTEKPILRWNFFPSSEMVFSRSIWDLKWLLITRACEGWFATTRGPRQTKRKPFHYAVKNSRVKLVFWLGMEQGWYPGIPAREIPGISRKFSVPLGPGNFFDFPGNFGKFLCTVTDKFFDFTQFWKFFFGLRIKLYCQK